MASLSIVVPRLGPNELFENTLASVLRYRMPHHQLLVVQSDLQADTYGLESEVDFVDVSGKPSLAKYLNLGLAHTRTDYINVIRPGIEVTNQWFAPGFRALQDRSVASAACSLVAANFRDEIVSRGISSGRNFIPSHVADPLQSPAGPSSWAGFYRAEVLNAIGQLDESLSDEFVGLDLALSHRHLGLKCQVITDRVLSIADERLLRPRNNTSTGCDSRRMIQRHVHRNDQGIKSAIAFAHEVLANGWRPSRWSRLMGRMSARNKRATDQGFLRRIDLACHALSEIQELPIRRAA